MKENIFSSFYAKVLSFFTSGKNEGESARDNATNRLKLVLMQDRSNLDGATMQKMREQLVAVISKYIEIDTEALDLNLEGDGEEIALMLNIPVIRARTKEEIEEIEAQEEEAKRAEIEEALKAQSEDKNQEENLDNESSEEHQDNDSDEEVVEAQENSDENESDESEFSENEDTPNGDEEPTINEEQDESSKKKHRKTKKYTDTEQEN